MLRDTRVRNTCGDLQLFGHPAVGVADNTKQVCQLSPGCGPSRHMNLNSTRSAWCGSSQVLPRPSSQDTDLPMHSFNEATIN